jgi:hypothetical protein
MYMYPNYTYRYRLTVNIEIDGQIRSASSVIEVTWSKHPELPGAGSFSPTLRGQAAMVDLGERGVVVATLVNGEDYGPAKDGALGALWIAAEAFGNHSTYEEIPNLPKLLGKRDLALNNLPRFLWFSNPQDLTTAKKLLVQDIPSIFGPSARFAGASVEITSDPITIDLREKLPWIKSLEGRPLGTPPIYLSNKLTITRGLFIGGAS